MSCAWRLAAFVLIVSSCLSVRAAEPGPTAQQVADWVEQLGDNDFTTRDKAARGLFQAGRAAEDALRKALKSDDAEVRRRAADILERFKWGIYPDTPKEVVELIKAYQGGNREDRKKVVADLFARGPGGCAALVRIARAEDDADFRQELYQQLSADAARAVPEFLAAGQFETLDELMELSITVRGDDRVLQNYAAYWLLRGKLDERIALMKPRAEKEDDVVAPQALAFLLRAKGDRDAAAGAAEKCGRADLVQSLLVEAADWKALSRRAEKDEAADVEGLGLRAAYHRLAGNNDAFDKALVELRKQDDSRPAGDFFWLPIKSLLINAGPGEVLDRLPKTERASLGFDILIAQMKVKEALEFAEKATPGGEAETVLQFHRARALAQLGEKDKAREVFDKFGSRLEKEPSVSWADDLIKNEFRAGFRDEAREHLAHVLAGPRGTENPQTLIGLVFPQRKESAALLWQALRLAEPDAGHAAHMTRLAALLEGKPKAGELKTLLESAARKAREQPSPQQIESWLLVLGETALNADLIDDGLKYLREAAKTGLTPAGHLKIGDHYVAREEWERAAEAYALGREKDQRLPMPAWLEGWAATKAGRAKEGAKLMELAHWLPLGNEQVRHQFCKELQKRGGKEAREALQREAELVERCGAPNSYYAGEVMRLAATQAVERKDYLRAAELQDRALLRILSPYTEFIEQPAYVSVPHFIHGLRARGLAAAGRVADARREIAYCQGLLPGNVDLPIQIVPELDKRNEKVAADEVFAHARSVNEKVIADYPRSASHRNNLAWMCALCRRELDKGLAHATEAVKLAPDNAGYLDTLAEVHFQRGDATKAIELMKKCVEMDPKRGYYRKQLTRFESGDRTAELPTADEDD